MQTHLPLHPTPSDQDMRNASQPQSYWETFWMTALVVVVIAALSAAVTWAASLYYYGTGIDAGLAATGNNSSAMQAQPDANATSNSNTTGAPGNPAGQP